MLRKTLEYWYPTIGFGISISLLLWRSPCFLLDFLKIFQVHFLQYFQFAVDLFQHRFLFYFLSATERSVKGMKVLVYLTKSFFFIGRP